MTMSDSDTLKRIEENTRVIPSIREELVWLKASQQSVETRVQELCRHHEQLDEKTDSLTERLAAQEAICKRQRESRGYQIPIQAAQVSGKYKLKAQWIVLIGTALVALASLIGQVCTPIPARASTPRIQAPPHMPHNSALP
jgi:septal ring factor EnvC (AmiA/AmiB activator)